MHSIVLFDLIPHSRQTIHTSMVSVSPMELLVPGNTFGLLQVDLEIKLFEIATTVHVMAMSILHHLSVKTIFVRRPMMLCHLGQLLGLRSMIPYGMVKTAQQLSPVSVPSTTHPGSASSFPSPQLMTSRCVSVEAVTLVMKTHLSSLWNSTFTNVTLWEQPCRQFLINYYYRQDVRV